MSNVSLSGTRLFNSDSSVSGAIDNIIYITKMVHNRPGWALNQSDFMKDKTHSDQYVFVDSQSHKEIALKHVRANGKPDDYYQVIYPNNNGGIVSTAMTADEIENLDMNDFPNGIIISPYPVRVIPDKPPIF